MILTSELQSMLIPLAACTASACRTPHVTVGNQSLVPVDHVCLCRHRKKLPTHAAHTCMNENEDALLARYVYTYVEFVIVTEVVQHNVSNRTKHR